MHIFQQELEDGLGEQISKASVISYASIVEPCEHEERSKINIKNNKILAGLNDADLYYVQSILVSSSWNKNDDIFDKLEVWQARHTPEDKPTNLEHNENLIIGHITSNWPIDDDGNYIDDNIDINNLPNKFHILTGSVIYKAFSNTELKERAEKLIEEIENSTKYVSMECYFKNFDYGLIDKSTGNYTILPRNNETAYLTKHLRAYGGMGEHENFKIGRLLRNITFSGKGFVDKPANPDSIIFTKTQIDNLFNKKNSNSSNSGVLLNTLTTNAETETYIMTDDIEKHLTEMNTKLENVSASCVEQANEAKALAADLQNTNQNLEAAMKEKDNELLKANEALDMVKAEAEKLLSEKTFEFEEAAKKWKDEKAMMEEEMNKVKSEVQAMSETIAAYKMKEEEMAKKEKMMKRKASLLEAGLDAEQAEAATSKFENIDDESFEAMTSILAAMKPPKKEDDAKVMPSPKKEKASEEEVEAALEEVEPTEDVNLSVGNDETEAESAEASIRTELVEFVSARLRNNK